MIIDFASIQFQHHRFTFTLQLANLQTNHIIKRIVAIIVESLNFPCQRYSRPTSAKMITPHGSTIIDPPPPDLGKTSPSRRHLLLASQPKNTNLPPKPTTRSSSMASATPLVLFSQNGVKILSYHRIGRNHPRI